MEEAALDKAPIWDCIESFKGEDWRGVVDIILASIPCQPFSCAGKQLGESDPRHLWPHVARIVRQCEPTFVFIENVDKHITNGFSRVAGDLEAMGYAVAAGIFTAAEVGAPHLRKRLYALAYSESARSRAIQPNAERPGDSESDGRCETMADSDSIGRRGQLEQPISEGKRPRKQSGRNSEELGNPDCAGLQGGRRRGNTNERDAFPPGREDFARWSEALGKWPNLEPTVLRVADGLSDKLDFSATDRIHAMGEANVPLTAAFAFCYLLRELQGD